MTVSCIVEGCTRRSLRDACSSRVSRTANIDATEMIASRSPMIRNTDRPLRRRCHERWRDGIRNGLREDRIDLVAARLIDVPALDLLQRVELLGAPCAPGAQSSVLGREPIVRRACRARPGERHGGIPEYYLTVPFPSRLTRSRRVISSKGTGRLMR